MALHQRLRTQLAPQRWFQTRSRLLRSVVLGSIAAGFALVPSAQAERPVGLKICVSSAEPRNSEVYVALAYKTQNKVAGVGFEDWVSQGWWKIPKELSYSCITLLPEELENRFYYLYAQGAGRVWDGKYRFCMDPLKSYATDEADINCEASGYALRGFRQIDTKGDRGFTYRLY